MQAQMALGQALDEYAKKNFANSVMDQCWTICYDRNLERSELVQGEVPDATLTKMDNCARKCVARHFEVMTMLIEAREIREKEQMQGLAPGTLKNAQQ